MSLLRRRMMMGIGDEGLPIGIDLAEVYGVIENVMITGGKDIYWSVGIASDYIPVKTEYVFELKTTCDTWEKVAFYDADKVFLNSSGLGKYPAGTYVFGNGTSYAIPAEAKYMRVQLKGQAEGEYYIKRIA